MSATFIIDCSITMAWCFADEATAATEKVRDRLEKETVLAPSLWLLEVTNVLALAERKNRITVAQSNQFISLLELMDIEVDNEAPPHAFSRLLPLCRGRGLTAYDAVYLELAIRRQLPLATLDDELRAQACASGVKVFGK